MSTTVDLPLLPLGRGKDLSSERGVECPGDLPAASDPDLVERARAAKEALGDAKTRGDFSYEDLVIDQGVAKVSVVGIGMRSHAGVAAQMFKALAAENVNIKVITTSEIKVSVLIDRKYLELAVQALHDAFELEKAS